METNKLKTETDTPEMHARIVEAFRVFGQLSWQPRALSSAPFAVDFEHGQWWVTVNGSGAQYSVVDAEGRTAVDGFDFEQVTEGEES
jgi:hypothetical protein